MARCAPRRPLAGLPLVLALALAGGVGDDGGARWDPGPECDAFETASCLDAGRVIADVVTLAAPAMSGRRAGTPGNDAAVDLVAGRFEALGLAPVAGAPSVRDPFPLRVWTASRAPTLRLGTASYTVGDGEGLDVVEFSGAGTVASADVAFVGHGIVVPPYDPADYPACPVDPNAGYDDYAGLDVTGMVVVVLRGYPGDDLAWRVECPLISNTTKARAAAQRGAAAVVFAPRFGAGWSGATADHFRLSSSGAGIPALQITRAALEAAIPNAATWQTEIDASRTPSSHIVAGVSAEADVQGATEERLPENVLAVVRGTDPVLRDEVVVIGAHLDHMGEVPFRSRYYPGADDNASGTAVLLELARAVSQSATQPKRTLLFAAWNAEELGLIGSSRYVDAPAYPLAGTVAAFSIDMVGDGSPGMLVYGGTEFPGIPATMQAGADALALPDAWQIHAIGPSGGSDHAPFAEKGVPAVLFLTPQFEDHAAYHTPADTAGVVSRETLEAAAKLVWATVREYALGTEQPRSLAIGTSTARATRGAVAEPSRALACFGPRPGLDAEGER